MIEVETRQRLYAVQWPEGMTAQLAVRDELKTLGITVELYDGMVVQNDAPHADGSFAQWTAVNVGARRWAALGDWIVVFQAPVTEHLEGLVQTYPAALFAVLFDEVPDTTECTAEVWSWEVFRHGQVDPYWIRCTKVGPHQEHEDSNTGATWTTTHLDRSDLDA